MASRDIVVELARTENPDDPHGFRFVPQTYTVRTEGGGRRSFEVAWSRELLAELDAVRRPGRDPEVVARLGERLRVMLAPTGLEALVNELPGSQDGALATITLRSSAAEIYALPMELITRRETGEHVGALPRMLIRYEWPETRTTPPSVEPRPEGGRILFAWSAAAGPVAASDQLQAIREEAARGNLSFSTDEDVVEHASCGRITAALAAAERAERPFAILHLLCHGAVAGSSYGLALDDEDGDVVVVDAGRLRQLLAPYTGTLRLVVLAACDGGNVGDPGSRLGSVAQTLHRAGIEAVVASRYPLSVSGAVTLTRRLYHELLVRLRSLEEAFVAARVELGGDQATLDWASVQLHARIEDGGDTRPIVVRPYRGLLPFQTCHSRLFFGRDRERTEILRDLAALTDAGAPRLLVVAGASGTGKSSLVLAGAVPDLVGDEAPPEADGLRQRAVSCLEELAARGDDPAAREALAALRRSAHPAARGDGWECAVMRPGVNPNARLAEALAGRVDPGRSLLLVVDQFEELFTHTAEPSERERFGRRLWALARGDDDVHCILTIRVDFLGRCGEIVLDDDGVRLDRVAYDEQHRVFIAQMGPEQLRGAIEGPARLVGLSLQEGLSARMLDEVRGEPGALPLLQYALDLLWQRRRGRLLSMEEHERLGGVAGALQRRADALVDELDALHQQQARRLFTRLVGVGEGEALTRRCVPLAQLARRDPDEQRALDVVLDGFVSARLLVRDEEGGAATVEVAHEAFIRGWERLRLWLREDQGKLGELAKLEQWVALYDEHKTVLQGDQLGYALEVAGRYPEDIDESTRALLDESREQASAVQRRRRLWLISTAVSAVIMAAVAVWALFATREALVNGEKARVLGDDAFNKQRLAERNAEQARCERELARGEAARARDVARLAGAGQAQQDREVYAAIGLLREIEATAPTLAVHGWVDAVYELLARESWTRSVFALGVTPTLIIMSDDGARVFASAGAGGAIWEADGERGPTIQGDGGSITAAAFSGDGARLVTASELGIAAWDAGTGRLLAKVSIETGMIGALAVDASGEAALFGDDRGAVAVWPVGADAPRPMRGRSRPVVSVEFTDDDARLRSLATDRSFAVWDARDGALRGRRAARFDEISVAGRSAIALLEAGVESLQQVAVFSEVTEVASYVRSAAMHGPSRWLLVGLANGAGRLVQRIETGLRLDTELMLQGHSDALVSIGFSADGRRVATASADGTARVWQLPGENAAVDVSSVYPGLLKQGHFGADGQRVLLASNALVAINGDGSPVVIAEMSTNGRHELSVSADGRRVAVWSSSKVERWDLLSRARLRVLGPATAATQSDDHLFVAAPGGVIHRYRETARGELLFTAGEEIAAMATSGDGTRLVVGGASGSIWVISAAGRVDAKFDGHRGAVRRVVVDRSARWALSAGDDHRAAIVDLSRGAVFESFDIDVRVVTAATIAEDGQRALVGFADGGALYWTKAGGGETVGLRGHTRPVIAATLTDDGDAITLAASGEQLRWRVQLGAARLIEALWRATSLCPDVEDRQRYTGASARVAAQDAARCEAMVTCLKEHAYERCRLRFLAERGEQLANGGTCDPDAPFVPRATPATGPERLANELKALIPRPPAGVGSRETDDGSSAAAAGR